MKFAELTLSRAGGLGRVMTSQAVSTYANQLIAFVIPWLILSRTGSAWNAGVTAFAMGLASLVGILMAGLIIDRMGGRKISVVADGLSFVTAAALATALYIDFLPLWFVIVSQAFGVFFDGPGTIAKNILVPEEAQRENVPVVRALGLQQTFQNAAMFLGPVSGLSCSVGGQASEVSTCQRISFCLSMLLIAGFFHVWSQWSITAVRAQRQQLSELVCLQW